MWLIYQVNICKKIYLQSLQHVFYVFFQFIPLFQHKRQLKSTTNHEIPLLNSIIFSLELPMLNLLKKSQFLILVNRFCRCKKSALIDSKVLNNILFVFLSSIFSNLSNYKNQHLSLTSFLQFFAYRNTVIKNEKLKLC